jgi:hypothetical protein
MTPWRRLGGTLSREEAHMSGSRSDTRSNWQADSRRHELEIGEPTGWATWLVFAGIMLAVVGLFEVIVGLTALFDEGFFVVRSDALVVSIDYSVWGWAHLVLGMLALVTAYFMVRGIGLGLAMGVVLAAVVIVVNLIFLPAYPWWSTLAIAFNVLVIYAITRHHGELRAGG